MDIDLRVRIAAFDWLSDQATVQGATLPRKLLVEGFEFEGNRVPLVSPQGIFKPAVLDLPLSVTTSPVSPYDDSFTVDGLLLYRYRGKDPEHRDNVGLRKVYEKSLPLVYFHGVVPGKYLAVWPVYIVVDDPEDLSVTIAVDELNAVNSELVQQPVTTRNAETKRAYLTATVKRRLHQSSFREKVLEAYRTQCSFCQLKHRELLDAAHIIPDHIAQSRPKVSNGMALCKLHHAAYDSLILGVTPEFVVQVREDVLREEDGPILKYGLKELHQTKIQLPVSEANWPSQESLEWRFERFRAVA